MYNDLFVFSPNIMGETFSCLPNFHDRIKCDLFVFFLVKARSRYTTISSLPRNVELNGTLACHGLLRKALGSDTK